MLASIEALVFTIVVFFGSVEAVQTCPKSFVGVGGYQIVNIVVVVVVYYWHGPIAEHQGSENRRMILRTCKLCNYYTSSSRAHHHNFQWAKRTSTSITGQP